MVECEDSIRKGKDMNTILVIGGGPAGMMAAYKASEQNNKVILVERNDSLGKKLLLTGSGKCNYSNENLLPEKYNFGESHPFSKLLSVYDSKWLENFFKEHGMLTDRRDGLLYPRSERSDTVKELFENLLIDSGVEILVGKKAVSVDKNEKFTVRFEDGEEIEADKLIIATGGKAYPSTGSDGAGYRLARGLGHEVTFTYPVLTRLLTSDKDVKRIAGVRIKAKVSAWVDGKILETTEGEIQFNENALSGICIFQLSRFMSKPLEEGKECYVHIDFAPEMKKEEVKVFIEKALSNRPEADVEKIIKTMFGNKTAEMIISKAGDVTVEKIAEVIKDSSVKIDNHDSFKDAQVTRGGVCLSEVDNNMESKICEGLFFAGEVLDVDGTCGGYNLHFAFMSGYAAGLKAAL